MVSWYGRTTSWCSAKLWGKGSRSMGGEGTQVGKGKLERCIIIWSQCFDIVLVDSCLESLVIRGQAKRLDACFKAAW